VAMMGMGRRLVTPARHLAGRMLVRRCFEVCGAGRR
jgi:hypothetical protein